MSDTKTRRGPVIIEADLSAETAQDAAPVPEIVGTEGRAMQQVTMLAARKSGWLSKLFWGGVTGLLGMMASVAAWDFVNGLLVRNVYLGQIAMGLMGLVALVLTILALREGFAFLRLNRIDALRAEVEAARAASQRPRAEGVVQKIGQFYAGREELRWARTSLAEHSENIFDAPDLIDLAERHLMEPLDRAAVAEVQMAARNVAAATALLPLAA